MENREKLLFAQIDSGTEAFRSWATDLVLVRPNREYETVERINVDAGGWTNATYGDEMRRMGMIEKAASEILNLAGWKQYRGNGQRSWIKGVAFPDNDEGIEAFRQWAGKIGKKIRKMADEWQFGDLKNELLD